MLEFFSCDMGEKNRATVGHFDIRIDDKLVLENQATMGRGSLASAALAPLTLTSHGRPVVVKLVRRDGDPWVNGLIQSGTVRLGGDQPLGRMHRTHLCHCECRQQGARTRLA